MSTFEIQIYKSGAWNVDSYFDDRNIAMSEAERLTGSGRHAGVRILQEDYNEASNETKSRVVFSKTVESDENQEARAQAKGAPKARAGATGGGKVGKARPSRGRSSPKKSNASLYIGFAVAFLVLIAGIAAMIALQEYAKLP